MAKKLSKAQQDIVYHMNNDARLSFETFTSGPQWWLKKPSEIARPVNSNTANALLRNGVIVKGKAINTFETEYELTSTAAPPPVSPPADDQGDVEAEREAYEQTLSDIAYDRKVANDEIAADQYAEFMERHIDAYSGGGDYGDDEYQPGDGLPASAVSDPADGTLAEPKRRPRLSDTFTPELMHKHNAKLQIAIRQKDDEIARLQSELAAACEHINNLLELCDGVASRYVDAAEKFVNRQQPTERVIQVKDANELADQRTDAMKAAQRERDLYYRCLTRLIADHNDYVFPPTSLKALIQKDTILHPDEGYDTERILPATATRPPEPADEYEADLTAMVTGRADYDDDDLLSVDEVRAGRKQDEDNYLLDAEPDLCELIEEVGFDPRDYSGRGMYGKVCIGVTCDDPLSVIQDITEIIMRDYKPAVAKTFLSKLRNHATDDMGLSQILYWPRIAWPETREVED